jgi:hypothetical protein
MAVRFKVSTQLIVGMFIGFVLTSLVFTFIITEGFVAKEFLRQNYIYLDGKYYKLCRSSKRAM